MHSVQLVRRGGGRSGPASGFVRALSVCSLDGLEAPIDLHPVVCSVGSRPCRPSGEVHLHVHLVLLCVMVVA